MEAEHQTMLDECVAYKGDAIDEWGTKFVHDIHERFKGKDWELSPKKLGCLKKIHKKVKAAEEPKLPGVSSDTPPHEDSIPF
jgi:hypothetical protein